MYFILLFLDNLSIAIWTPKNNVAIIISVCALLVYVCTFLLDIYLGVRMCISNIYIYIYIYIYIHR